MYAVVGCSDCRALWVLEGRPETSECPRCGTRRPTERRRRFVETEDADAARQARARLLAERSDQAEAFAEVEPFDVLEERLDDAGVDDDSYLEGSGVDSAAARAAGERADRGAGGGSSSGNRREVIEAAVRDLDHPTEAEVVDYATDRGVPEERVHEGLEKLRRQGTLTERDGRYRLL